MKKSDGIKLAIFSFIVFFVVILDRLTKNYISKNYTLNESKAIIQGVFHRTYVHNYGAGFSILQNQRWLFIIFALIVIAAIFYYYSNLPKNYVTVATALLLGGTIGNLIDRIIYGYVIDFLDFMIWPKFNLADSAITIGALFLVYYFWKS